MLCQLHNLVGLIVKRTHKYTLGTEFARIAVRRREVKSKVEKERYKHLNAEFQRIARDKKPSSGINAKKQRKRTKWERLEISSRKLDIPGNISCKNGFDKDRNGMDLTKEEDTEKRW